MTDQKLNKANDILSISFVEWIAGAQTTFEVPEKPRVPRPIQSMKDDAKRQIALDAWDAAWTLSAYWTLWRHFLVCGTQRTFPDKQTQAAIAQRFPNLAAMSAVLEVLSHPKPLRGKKRRERDLVDERAGIERGHTRRISRHERRNLRGRCLQDLITAFQSCVKNRIRVLCLLGLRPLELNSTEEVISDALRLMSVTLNFDGENEPIDFQLESGRLTDKRALRIRSLIGILLSLLEEQPTVALSVQSKPEVSPYLGIRLDSKGTVTRDGFEGEMTLSPIPCGLLRLLVEARGELVEHDQIKCAWPKRVKVSSGKIHTEVGRLKKAIEDYFDLEVVNTPRRGYSLFDAARRSA